MFGYIFFIKKNNNKNVFNTVQRDSFWKLKIEKSIDRMHSYRSDTDTCVGINTIDNWIVLPAPAINPNIDINTDNYWYSCKLFRPRLPAVFSSDT